LQEEEVEMVVVVVMIDILFNKPGGRGNKLISFLLYFNLFL
jgi:hypothetical protein